MNNFQLSESPEFGSHVVFLMSNFTAPVEFYILILEIKIVLFPYSLPNQSIH